MRRTESALDFVDGASLVVATSLASVHALMVQYLKIVGKKASRSFCDLYDGTYYNFVTLEEFKKLSGGLDPFELPPDKPVSDSQAKILTKLGFRGAMRVKPGIPPGSVSGNPPSTKLPTDFIVAPCPHPVRNLWNLSMYFSEVTTVTIDLRGKRTPVFCSQARGNPWYVVLRTKIKPFDLKSDLDIPFFNLFPADRAEIKSRLDARSATGMTLQQMLLDLTWVREPQNCRLQIPDSVDPLARVILTDYLASAWTRVITELGAPILGIMTIAQDGKYTNLPTKKINVVYNSYKDGNREPVKNPPRHLARAATIDYMGFTWDRDFDNSVTWNWLLEAEVSEASGVIAISRSTFGRYLLHQLKPHVYKYCLKPQVAMDVHWDKIRYDYRFDNEPPSLFGVTQPGVASVVEIAHNGRGHTLVSGLIKNGSFTIDVWYKCSVEVRAKTVCVYQGFRIWVEVTWCGSRAAGDLVNKTRKDLYDMAVDARGSLELKHNAARSESIDNSTSERQGGFQDFLNLDGLLVAIRERSRSFIPPDLGLVSIEDLRSFTFPGAKVFAFKEPIFSIDQDLTCLITYIQPTIEGLAEESPETVLDGLESVTSLTDAQAPVEFLSLDDFMLQSMNSSTLRLEHPDDVEEVADITEPHPDELTGFFALDTTDQTDTSIDLPTLEAEIPPDPNVTVGGLTQTTELMQNYVQGSLVPSQSKFRALQDDRGYALLFALNAQNVFTVIGENIEKTGTGWSVYDLSSTTLARYCPHGAKVSHFDVGQSAVDGTISLAMIVQIGNSDKLLLSLHNSAKDVASWIKNPQWKFWAFDAADHYKCIRMSSIYFSETTDKSQYILVDVLQDPESAIKSTVRYLVNVDAKSGPYWTKATLPFQIEHGSFQSCMGRIESDEPDGIYTLGTINGTTQLGFIPIFGEDGSAPMPVLLRVPGTTQPSAIASARYGIDSPQHLLKLTHFYAVAGSTLYNWAPNEQNARTEGKPLMSNDLFAGTTTLVALTRNKVTTIFGKNASNIVYYTSCPVERLGQVTAWSVPVPVASGAEHITALINVEDGGNTVFTTGGTEMQRIIQASNTPGKLWQAQKIVLPAPPESKPLAFQSYTTVITLKATDGMPVIAGEVVLTAKIRTPVYINGLYYIVSSTPITVKSDLRGTITIIQAADGIVGTAIVATSSSHSVTINPMQSSFEKLTKFTNKSELRNAKLYSGIKAGGVVGSSTTEHLVSPQISDADVEAVSESMKALKKVHERISTRELSPDDFSDSGDSILVVGAGSEHIEGIGDAIAIAIGDLWSWLRSGVKTGIQLLKIGGQDLWQIVVDIGGKLYRAVMNTILDIVIALDMVFEKIKAGAKRLFDYLSWLFEWEDIKRTKAVFHKTIILWVSDAVDGLRTMEGQLNTHLEESKALVRDLTGNTDWSKLGAIANRKPGDNAGNANVQENAGSQMLASHFRDQCGQITFPGDLPCPDDIEILLDGLIDALSAQADVLVNCLQQLEALSKDFSRLSLADAIKRLVGIIAEAVIGSTQTVVTAIFKVLYKLAKTAVDALNIKIHIPIISDILSNIGVPEVSMLDLLAWIAAVPATLLYKAWFNAAPFPDNAATKAILRATDLLSLKAAIEGKSHTTLKGQAEGFLPQTMYVMTHMFGAFACLIGLFPMTLEKWQESPNKFISVMSLACSIVIAAGPRAGAFILSKEPIRNTVWFGIGIGTTSVTIIFKAIFSSSLHSRIRPGSRLSKFKISNPKEVGSLADVIMIIPAQLVTVAHLQELIHVPNTSARACALLSEATAIASYINRTASAVATWTKDPDSKLAAIAIMGASTSVQCGFLILNAGKSVEKD